MSERIFNLINGSPFEYALASGEMRVDYVNAAGTTQTNTYTPTDGTVTFTPSVVSTYYLATRKDSTEPWCRVGRLIVSDLVDATEEQLKSELTAINKLIKDSQTSLVQFQVTDPSGTAITRMTLNRALEARGKIEVRLAELYRLRSGRYPLRLA